MSALRNVHGDNAALRACNEHGGALATVVEIEGSFSRRLGAQLSIAPDGTVTGSLADGCLESAVARLAEEGDERRMVYFGGESDALDLRLPCGSRLAVIVDPRPDQGALGRIVADLDARREATLSIAVPGAMVFVRRYRPELRLVVLGTGPECDALVAQARAFGAQVVSGRPLGSDQGDADAYRLSLGKTPAILLDAWSAVAVLFHDHEWERAILPWALRSDAFYVGAQGGAAAREERADHLDRCGLRSEAGHKLHAPIGLIGHARDPSVLALSVLAQVVAAYEAVPL